MQRNENTPDILVDEDARIGPASDIALMRRVRESGDTNAFALLAGRYRSPLRRFFAALLPGPATQSDDFAQETLLRLWLSRERWQPTGVFSAYLFQIARHFYLNQREQCRVRSVREISVETGGMAGEPFEIAASPGHQPEIVALAVFEQARIRRAVEMLPSHYKTVFALRHDSGLSYVEIAENLGIPVGTVKSRLSEAIRRLRQALESEE